MTIDEAISEFKERAEDSKKISELGMKSYIPKEKGEKQLAEWLEELKQYRAIGTPEECMRNKDFLDFLSGKMNPNDFETYLRLYNALEGGDEERAKKLNHARFVVAMIAE